MTGSEVLDKTKKVADKMAMGFINAIGASYTTDSGSVGGVTADFLRPSKGGTCPPHLVKRRAGKEVDKESVESKEETCKKVVCKGDGLKSV
ncbi:hypothetical protein DHEL01_v206127 [Diaporthe helianthi]|uniref:Uncharacterized protein n=1 Tax=Diaporthe helianthi TaxID=158607 RepID=A0A2P5HZ19_DIAHE|nr:hypothetical protein DHEL01_v206127 [Diaporthe helianthi]